MDYAYTYKARTPRGKLLDGFVFARSRALAFSKLKRNGFQPISIALSAEQTVRSIVSPEFNQAELSRFYATIGRRINNNRSFLEGLDAAIEFITDPRLRQSIMVMRQAAQDGQTEKEAMLTAEFPARDAMVIGAANRSGNTGDAFIELSREIAQAHSMRKAVKQIFRMPMMMAILMYSFFYGALVWVAPMTMKFLKNISVNLHMSSFNKAYFAFAEWFNSNLLIGSALYFTVPVLVFFFLRSQTFADMKDRSKKLRVISQKTDQAVLWNSYALLYDAATSSREACHILSQAASRLDSKVSFQKLGRFLEAGRTLDESVKPSGFPDFVVTGVKSAASSGNLTEGIHDMVRNLDEDVITLTETLKENVKTLAVVLMACGVGLIFFVTYYPIVSSVLTNL
jgi:type II secretory pathway component PulF